MEEKDRKDNKCRILFLEHYLLDHSDREHPVTTAELMAAYAQSGLEAHRNTIADDLKTLIKMNIQIESVRIGNGKGYYIANRPFETTELMTLIDAVEAAQFVSDRKTKALVRKIAAQAIEGERKDLIQTAYAAKRIKTDNDAAFSSLGTIAKAIKKGKRIEFQYIRYLPTKEIELRNEGKVYSVSPYTLVLTDGRYYAMCNDEEKNDMIPYRVDRMRNVQISKEDADLSRPFNLEEYCKYILRMYDGNKEAEDVTLIAKEYTLTSLIDQFGEDIATKVLDNGDVQVTLRVVPSATFFAWIFEFGEDISIIGPEHVKEDYQERLRKTIQAQEKC